MNAPRWFRLLLSRFTPKKKRAPRRPKCECGHLWKTHTAMGCGGWQLPDQLQDCKCKFNRLGQPARRAFAAVKEAS